MLVTQYLCATYQMYSKKNAASTNSLYCNPMYVLQFTQKIQRRAHTVVSLRTFQQQMSLIPSNLLQQMHYLALVLLFNVSWKNQVKMDQKRYVLIRRMINCHRYQDIIIKIRLSLTYLDQRNGMVKPSKELYWKISNLNSLGSGSCMQEQMKH